MDITIDPSQVTQVPQAAIMVVTDEQARAIQEQQLALQAQGQQVHVLTEHQVLQAQAIAEQQALQAQAIAEQQAQQALLQEQALQVDHKLAEAEAQALVDAQVHGDEEQEEEEEEIPQEEEHVEGEEEEPEQFTEQENEVKGEIRDAFEEEEAGTSKRTVEDMEEGEESQDEDVGGLAAGRKKKVRVLSDDEDEEEQDPDDDEYLDDDDASLRAIRTKGKFLCLNCGKGYTKPSGRDAHYVECRKKKMPFKCDKCQRSYSRKTQLQSHQKTHTGARPHQCGVCAKRFAWSNQLAQHAKSHEIGGKPFKCSQCGECYSEATALVQHVRSHPKEKKYECIICGESFSYIRDLRKHELVHALDEGPSGELDTLKPDASADLLTQSLQQSGLKPYGCPVCGKCFNRNEYLVQHMRMHTGEKPHECGECGEKFTWHNQLSFHSKQHPGKKVFKCQQCDEKFVESSELAQHAKIHPKKRVEITEEDIAKALARESTSSADAGLMNKGQMLDVDVPMDSLQNIMPPEVPAEVTAGVPDEDEELLEEDPEDPTFQGDVFKPYGCEYCGKYFARKLQLQSHARTHTGEKPHACGLCEKRFTWSNQLTLHVKMHHPGEKAYKCETCQECFLTSRELVLHNKTHKGAHECTACGLVFPNLKTFVKHTKQIHGLGEAPKKRGRKPKERTNNKDFQCDFCGICFARRDNLKEHLRVHTGAKPFQCDICGKFFRLMGHLVKHKRTHTGEKPYRCETCYKCFTDSSKLARHVQMHTGSRPYICRTCYRYFPGKEQLAEHAKTHAGERKIRKPTVPKTELICDTCGKTFLGTSDCTKCKNCRQITYECGICGDQFMDSSDLLEHTKLHSGDWAYQYIPQAHELAAQESADLTGQTIIQTSSGSFEFATRGQGGNLVIDVPAGATQEVIECILSSSDIVMQGPPEQHVGDNELSLVTHQVHQQQIQLQHEPIQQVNPNDMIQHVQQQQQQQLQQQQPQQQQQGTQQVQIQQQTAQQQQQQLVQAAIQQAQQQQQQQQAQQQAAAAQQQQQQQAAQQQQHQQLEQQIHIPDHTHPPPLESIPEEPAPTFPDDDDDEMDDDFFADLETQQGEDRGKPFECPDCGKKFRKERWMVRHRRIHLKPEDTNQAEDPELNSELNPVKHMIDEELLESEPDEGAVLDESDEDYEVGLKRKRGPGRPKRDDFGSSLPKGSFRVKLPKKMKKNGYECTICGKCFASAKWLAKHKDTPHTCAKCDKVFLRAKSLKEHMKTHMQEAKYKCPLCQEPQMKFVALLKHCATHDEGNYRCPSCNKLFRKLDNMVKHTRYHNQGVQHQCDTCGKSFWQKWSLRQHQKVHSGEQPYQCETCGKCFTNIGNYKSHNRVHTGEKPYICETCGKAFREGGHLVKHRRTHTGEKPYVCNTCTACFTDSSKLARHKKTQHSNFGKGYKCETCGKCFSRIDNLHTHEKTHTGEKTPRKSPAKARPPQHLQTVAAMVQQDPYHRFERIQGIEVEHHHQGQETHPGTPVDEGLQMEHPVHTIEILRTPQEQTDQRSDQQFLTLLVQRLNQGDDPRTVNVNLGQAVNVSALDPQVRVMAADPQHAHQLRTVQSYNLPTTHAIHPMHQVQMQGLQRPNVLNQFANVVDDYAIHYPAFLHRK